MGRSGCGPCCGEPILKTPCYDNSSKAYYKVGGGSWKTASEFEQYVAGQGKTGYYGLTAIKHVQKRSSYGEYSAKVRGYTPPKSGGFANGQGGSGTPSSNPYSQMNKDFFAGDPDIGLITPSLLTITIGSGNEAITIVRKYRAGPVTRVGTRPSTSYLGVPIDFYYTTVDHLVQYKGTTIFESETQSVYKYVWRFDLVGPCGIPGYYDCQQAVTREVLTAGGGPDFAPDASGTGSIYVEYCLTYPFFKLTKDWGQTPRGDGTVAQSNFAFTHYFDSGSSCDFIGPPEGTIDLPVPPPLYHADKSIFGNIEVEARDFIVFNPYSTNGLGRAAEPSDFKWWVPQVCDSEYVNSGPGMSDGYYGPPRHRDDCSPIRTTYIDNKLDGTSAPHPQTLGGIQNEPISQTVTFPVGFPGDYDPILAGGSVDFFRKYMSKNGLWEDNINTATKHVDDIIFVSFRTDRSANESGIDIEVDMEVYHPVGDDFKYTITEIVERGPNLKPTKVKLSNGAVVDVSEIELEEDILSYAMNGRTYYLQTLYLKSLGGDFHNPLKYRVSRIDLVNPLVDIGSIGDEIAGPGGSPPTKGGGNPTYVDLTDTKLSYGFGAARNVKACLKLFENGNNISLEMSDFLPRMRNAQLTATSRLGFQERYTAAQQRGPRSTAFSRDGQHGSSWIVGFSSADENVYRSGEEHKIGWKYGKNISQGKADITDNLYWKQSQLPKNGYFFGHDLALKFYIEDIDEWKKQQI